MSSMESVKSSAQRPRSRKSIAHMPSPDTVNNENITLDSAALAPPTKAAHKKSRSKSIGPGGLDALKETTGNRREAAATTLVKSILKPTIPLSPPKQIPPHSNARKQSLSPRKAPNQGSPQKQRSGAQEGILIDTSDGTDGVALPDVGLPNPFGGSSPKKGDSAGPRSSTQSLVAVRTEEEQQEAARERKRQEKEVAARKDARPNRRVSFAPEATLHTWNVVELPEDSTTSSASGNSTRRASALSAMVASPYPQPNSDASEPPSTPPAQAEGSQAKPSPAPAHQRDLHQKQRRRSSGIPPMNFNNPEEFSSSPYSGSSVNSDDAGSQAFVTADEADSSGSDDKDLVEDESTVTGVDNDDVTAQSNLSARSSTGSSGRLDEALRQAAKQAGTQGIEYDEHGDITMEMADDEVTNTFQPWMKEGNYVPQVIGNPSALQDQENINPFSPDFGSSVQAQRREDDAGETMDFTQAAGSILPSKQKSEAPDSKPRRRSSVGGRMRSTGNHRRSSGASFANEDATMDLTTAIGGIQSNQATLEPQQTARAGPQASDDDDEELTMEFTTILGGVLRKEANREQNVEEQNRRESLESSVMGGDMDITFAAGGILSAITERTEPPEDQIVEMDVTKAVGAVLPQPLSMSEKTKAKILMEQETDAGQLPVDPFYDGPAKSVDAASIGKSGVIFRPSSTKASESGSPSKGESIGRSNARSPMASTHAVTPGTLSRQTTPLKTVSTPSKQVTPQVGPRPTTPGKTPPSKGISLRTGSPKKLFEKESSTAIVPPKVSTKGSIFEGTNIHGAPTPHIVLKPRRRRSSGLGVDKEGLGSPRVTELLDRRSSINQSAQSFVSQGPAPVGVRFEDPRIMELELQQERAEDERRESGRGILQMEADSQDTEEQKDATTSLKDKIQSLTPQKKKPKPRKSLHVGAAKGLLGKRPAELDDEEDEDDTTLSRLKGREGSPVKKIKLPAPPSKNETTRRNLRSSRPSLVETLGNAKMNTPSLGSASPMKDARATTPQGQPRFKDVATDDNSENSVTSFETKLDTQKPAVVEPTETEDRIHLQDFLNMTSIRFMELTTTKRRLTVAPAVLDGVKDTSANSKQSRPEGGLEESIVAGACTVPMLELYQHSCRELKRYIAEGRSIVREIEADTYDDNPALFREYMTATPDVKAIMDNQFKNVKTHARLLSKAMWYEWRMKLLDGLKEGLVQISSGMDEDAESLAKQESLLEPVVPELGTQNERLQSEYQSLQAQAEELASCDQEELRQAREKLTAVDDDLQAKLKLLAELERDLQAKDESIQDAVERRDECHAEIKEAERVRQESRGWNMSEVEALQANVSSLETSYGWKITSASGSTLTMTYNDILQLYFTPTSFIHPNASSPTNPTTKANSPISLTYIADTHEHHPKPLTTEKRFFLQIMRVQLQCLRQAEVRTDELLNFVSRNWEAALIIAGEVRGLGTMYITDTSIMDDECMVVEALLLLKHIQTKLQVGFEVQARGSESVGDSGDGSWKGESGVGVGELDIAVKSRVKVVYGEGLKEGKMSEWVDGRLEEGESWVRAVGRLEERLRGRGRK
ncbi:MAG: hypothetical protein Q9181_002186 [Wetmoreana brouardii]